MFEQVIPNHHNFDFLTYGFCLFTLRHLLMVMKFPSRVAWGLEAAVGSMVACCLILDYPSRYPKGSALRYLRSDFLESD